MAQYYVIRNKDTGLYFRGKGVNRWGKHYNQASIYRVKAMAEHTIKEVSWRGEQAEIVPIQIIEGNADVVPKTEVAREIFWEIDKLLMAIYIEDEDGTDFVGVDILKYYSLKKKYTEDQT